MPYRLDNELEATNSPLLENPGILHAFSSDLILRK